MEASYTIPREITERYVINALKEYGGVLGGEESGHIVLLDYAKSGDAMMTALRISSIRGFQPSVLNAEVSTLPNEMTA